MSSPMPDVNLHIAMLVDEDGNGPLDPTDDYHRVVCASCGQLWACDEAQREFSESHAMDVMQQCVRYLLEDQARAATATLAMEPLTIRHMTDLVLAATLFAARLMRETGGIAPDINGEGGVAALRVGHVDPETGDIQEASIDDAPAAVRYGGRMITAALNQDHETVFAVLDTAAMECYELEKAGHQEDAMDLLVDIMKMMFHAIASTSDAVHEKWGLRDPQTSDE